MARLAALVPKPRVKLTRFHGVFAPNMHAQAMSLVQALAESGTQLITAVHDAHDIAPAVQSVLRIERGGWVIAQEFDREKRIVVRI